jgi:superfamily II helicase
MTEENTTEPEVSIEELQSQLETLVQENESRQQVMASKYGVGLNPADVVNIRLNCTLSAILSEEHRIRVEIMTQTMVSNILDSALNTAEKQETRKRLTEGIPGLDPNING